LTIRRTAFSSLKDPLLFLKLTADWFLAKSSKSKAPKSYTAVSKRTRSWRRASKALLLSLPFVYSSFSRGFLFHFLSANLQMSGPADRYIALVTGFYDWIRKKENETPFYIWLGKNKLPAFAGVCQIWYLDENGLKIQFAAFGTTLATKITSQSIFGG
jgi:hypothetical protein